MSATDCAKHTYNSRLCNISTQHFLQDINLDLEDIYRCIEDLKKRGPNVIFHQNPQDDFINACNHDISSLWRVNVNLQYVIKL